MTRRRVIRAATLLTVLAAIGSYLLFVRPAAGPSPPPVPAGLTDPLAQKMVESQRTAVRASPQSDTAWGELAMAFDAHEATAEAVACYRQAMALNPADARWPFLLASQLRLPGSEGDPEEVIRLYRLAAECSPPSVVYRTTAFLTLGDLLTETGRGEEAATLYERAFATDSSDPWAAYRMGMAAVERGETAKAGRILNGLARNPYAQRKSATALAELNRRAGRSKEADGFDYAAGLLPPDHHWANPFAAEVARFKRGRRALMDLYVAQEGGRDERATVHTATALADLYPSIETQMLLLRALVNAGDYPAAVAVADDILRDDDGKKLVTAHSFLGLARLGLADRAEAVGQKAEADGLIVQAAESLGESVRLKPDYAPGHLYQSKALLRLNRLPEAEAAARAAVGSRPEEWEMYLALADVLAALGRKAEAITVAENAVKLAHPNEPRPKQALEAFKK